MKRCPVCGAGPFKGSKGLNGHYSTSGCGLRRIEQAQANAQPVAQALAAAAPPTQIVDPHERLFSDPDEEVPASPPAPHRQSVTPAHSPARSTGQDGPAEQPAAVAADQGGQNVRGNAARGVPDPFRELRIAAARSTTRNRDVQPDFGYVIPSKDAREITDLLLSTKTRKRKMLLSHISARKRRQLPFQTVEQFNAWLLPEQVGTLQRCSVAAVAEILQPSMATCMRCRNLVARLQASAV